MQKPTILIVDDSPMMTQFLSIFLNKKYEVVALNSSLEALTSIESGATIPQLIVTDLDMPELDGQTFIQKIKNQLSDTPIIVVSGVKDSKQRIKCLEMGADDFITKPFHPAELEVRISKLLQPKEVTEETAETEEEKAKFSIVKELMKSAAIF